MNVVVWGINYAPEMTGIAPLNTALCEYLAESGHRVEMVTSFAYYPQWRKKMEDSGVFFRTDVENNVLIHRCWAYVPSRVSAMRRIVHEASFVALSFFRILTLRRPDVFVVVSPPLLLGAAAWLVGVIKKTPFVFHVQDLQPDAAVALGMVTNGVFTRALYWIESFGYSRAAKVSGISEGMIEKFLKKGVPAHKTLLFPNGVKLPVKLPPRGAFRSKYRISMDALLCVYSGNLGVKQGLDVLLDASAILQEKSQGMDGNKVEEQVIVIVIAGDGARREKLKNVIASRSLKNVMLLPLQPDGEYKEMLADADCTMITQQIGTGAFFFPSKLLSSVASAKPVLTVADEGSELAKAVVLGQFGINVPPERPELLAAAMRFFARGCLSDSVVATEVFVNGDNRALEAREVSLSPAEDELSRMGKAGLEFAKRYEMKSVLRAFENELLDLIKNRTNSARNSVDGDRRS